MHIPPVSFNPLPQNGGAINPNQQEGIVANPNPQEGDPVNPNPQEGVPANPNPQPPIEAAEEPKIQLPANDKSPWDKFSSYIEPFIQLLSGMFTRGIDFANHIVEQSDELITAVQVVFYRIICSPVFDPNKKAFKQMIHGFETQMPVLRKEIENLEGKFFEVSMILRDLQELEEVQKNVQATINKLDELIPPAAMRPRTAAIYEQLVRLRNEYGALNQALNDCVRHKTPKIMDPFQEMVGKFLETGIEVPKKICKDLTISWRIIETLMRNHVPRFKLQNLQRQIRLLNQDVSKDAEIPGATQPLKLRNIGNSCYMDSVLQALLCDKTICEKICQPLARGNLTIEEFRKRIAIQQELIKFIEAQQGNRAKSPFSQMEFVFRLLKGPSMRDFRDAVFTSDINGDFKRENLYDQLDAAVFMDFLNCEFMDCGFKYIEHDKVPEFPGLEYVRPEHMNMLPIPFLTDEHGRTYRKIENLITLFLRAHNEHEDNPVDQRRFNPQEMKVINAEEAAKVPRDVGEVRIKDFQQFHKLDELPDVLTVQFKRFVNERVPGRLLANLRKIEDAIELPAAKNGEIDLAKHCENPEYIETPDGKLVLKPVVYDIISYVVHLGKTIGGGHYISYVKKGGKYWKCDDMDENGYQEITKEEFLCGEEKFRNKDGTFADYLDLPIIGRILNNARHPYLVVLKRVPEEQQKVGQIPVENNQQPQAIPVQPLVQPQAPLPV